MRICYLANASSIHTQRWISHFAEHGWEVDLITWHPPASNSLLHPDVTIHRIFFPPHYIARYGALLEITRLIRKIRPDIIHAHYISHFGILAGLYSRLSGFKPIVLTALGSDVLIDAKGLKKWLIKYALKRADLITSGGENLKDAIINFGVRPEKIKLINHGVDTEEFSPQKRDKELREELKALDTPIVISNRGLKPIYNVESLIKAIPLVLKDFPDTKFVIVGDGSQENYLKQLAKSIGVWNSVRFPGWLPRNEFIRYVASADIYVSTSLSDGTSVSLLEAMSCGLPAVVTNIEANRPWIKNEENGYLFEKKDSKALAKCIINLINDSEKLEIFGKKNREIVKERGDEKKSMEKIEKLYIDLINNHEPQNRK